MIAREKRRAHFGFERAHHIANARLGVAKLFGGAFEASCLGRQHKGFILRRHENLPFLLLFPFLRVKSTGYKKLFTYYKIL